MRTLEIVVDLVVSAELALIKLPVALGAQNLPSHGPWFLDSGLVVGCVQVGVVEVAGAASPSLLDSWLRICRRLSACFANFFHVHRLNEDKFLLQTLLGGTPDRHYCFVFFVLFLSSFN